MKIGLPNWENHAFEKCEIIAKPSNEFFSRYEGESEKIALFRAIEIPQRSHAPF